jgi:hypothetical protein
VNPLHDVADIVTEHDVSLSSHGHDHEEPNSHNDQNDLGKQLEKSDTAGTWEASPRFDDADFALASNNGGRGLASKSPVERDNSLVFFREHRRCDSDHGDCSRDLEADKEGNGKQHAEKRLAADGIKILLVWLVLGVFHVLERAERAADKHGQDGCDLIAQSPESDGRSHLRPSLECRHTSEPVLRAGLGDDDVNPGHDVAGQ